MDFLIEALPPRPLATWVPTPGASASVGEANCTIRLKQSAPDMRPRYAGWTKGLNEIALGSNVQNGQMPSYASGGGPARTVTQRRARLTSAGFRIQDLRAPDTEHQPINIGTPQYSWNNRIASIYEVFRTGEKFLPLPGYYGPSPTSMPRGGQVPRLVDNENQEANLARAIANGTSDIMSALPRDLNGAVIPMQGAIDSTPDKKPPLFPATIPRV